ncbi:LrgB family protein [Alkalihalobacillus sp. MEB130]|uniref:LrgB family protein n=1 Tax=Alkalihalobacillus sp. MEB130 TaxID=2976704 RepID=UPI0028DEC624|nr:LrgB family protein [Alkalihalobacillus sp. MEB130]MDT8859340.1 LrgB family protein [Alkalihalobacillus sp. MEB130]
MKILLGVIFIMVTIGIYLASKVLYKRYPFPYMLPLLTSTIVLIIVLVVFQIPYETYSLGGRWLEMLLGPAVVALALPLYKQFSMLKQNFAPIMISVTTGAIVGIVSGLMMAKWLGIEKELVYSIVPKSVTTPVAMDIATTLGGIAPIAAILVMVAGVGGIVMAPYLFKLCKIDHAIGKGLGTGSGAHAIGTAKAIENSEKEGAASSVAMTLSAIIVSFIGPFIVFLFY